MSDRSVKKGRLYSCVHCEKAGKSYHEARYRVVGHILKHHLSLDQTPFYCSLCMFRCMTSEALHKHVTGYKRHQLMAEGAQVNNNHFLVKNESAKPICEGTDYRQLSLREQYSSSTSTEDPLSRTDDFLLSDFDALEEETQASFNPPIGNQVFETVNSSGLINVQVTPEMLAQLMQQKPANQSQQDLTHLNQGCQMLQPPPIQRQLNVPVAPLTQPSGSLLNQQVPFSVQPTFNNSAGTPLLDENILNTVISFPTPVKINAKKRNQTPKSAKLNTPKGSPPEDITNQLLGDLPDSPAFATIEPCLQFKPKPVSSVLTNTTCTQTDTAPEPEPKRQRRDEDPESTKAVLEALGKITSAIDWNSRAIRNQDRTISQVVNVLCKLQKSVTCIADELQKKDPVKKGKENLGSPDRKALKSIVKKK